MDHGLKYKKIAEHKPFRSRIGKEFLGLTPKLESIKY